MSVADSVRHLQVMQQFALSFEFNERFLHTLFVHSYYSIYGKPALTKYSSILLTCTLTYMCIL